MYTHSTICTWMYYLYTDFINWYMYHFYMYYVDICTISICIIYMYYISWNIAHDICHISISHISFSEQHKNFNRTVIMQSDLNIKFGSGPWHGLSWSRFRYVQRFLAGPSRTQWPSLARPSSWWPSPSQLATVKLNSLACQAESALILRPGSVLVHVTVMPAPGASEASLARAKSPDGRAPNRH